LPHKDAFNLVWNLGIKHPLNGTHNGGVPFDPVIARYNGSGLLQT